MLSEMKHTQSALSTSPSKMDEDCHTFHINRHLCDYVNNSERFIVRNKSYMRQYAHIYAHRLLVMRSKLIKSAQSKWGKDTKIKRLCDLDSDEKCVIVGTLYKDMQMRPSILKEVSQGNNLIPQPIDSRYTDDSDRLILEDELQRILLIGNIDAHFLVTGIVIAVLGSKSNDSHGKFVVEDTCFSQPHQSVPLPITPEKDSYVALVSGLNIGSKSPKLFQMQMLIDLLTGQLGDPDLQSLSSSVVAIIVAGNSLSRDTQDYEVFNKAKYLMKNTSAGSVDAIKHLDEVLGQLASNMNVFIMPGEYDPTNHIFPQQPLHPCMFTYASKLSTLKSVTNPYDCTINGIRFCGTSGQPIDNIYAYTRLDDRLSILEKTLTWGHLAPTTPDSLSCYPYYDNDPFIMSECPHVYFVGNQKAYESKVHQGLSGESIRLVCIPAFSDTGQCVLINLRTLECEILQTNDSFSGS